MGRATSGVSGMKYAEGDSVLSMSVIRAAQAAAEDSEENVQYVFTMTDGGFAKRTRISDYRLTNRGTKGVKAMTLANEQRGVLVGGFIVEDGDEILSITQGGQVVRSPINEDFRPTGRATMGVKFVTPKEGDAVAVVARSIEAKVTDELEAEDGTGDGSGDGPDGATVPDEVAGEVATEVLGEAPEPDAAGDESENAGADATIDGDDASE
jgi:DNA gyrase subunit A